jgi:hypothetical protein
MTTAQLVNLILDKLRTGRVEFLHIVSNGYSLDFRYGGLCYSCEWDAGSVRVNVGRWHENKTHTTSDNYSRWIEGVLNGKIRDENGVLS